MFPFARVGLPPGHCQLPLQKNVCSSIDYPRRFALTAQERSRCSLAEAVLGLLGGHDRRFDGGVVGDVFRDLVGVFGRSALGSQRRRPMGVGL